MPVYDEIYIKAKVRKFNSVIKTKCLGDETTKENFILHLHSVYNYWFYITIDSGKKNYPQVYLEEWKYKIKMIKVPKNL